MCFVYSSSNPNRRLMEGIWVLCPANEHARRKQIAAIAHRGGGLSRGSSCTGTAAGGMGFPRPTPPCHNMNWEGLGRAITHHKK